MTEKLHAAIWPKTCEKTFIDLLDRYPGEINKKYGLLEDTPMHR